MSWNKYHTLLPLTVGLLLLSQVLLAHIGVYQVIFVYFPPEPPELFDLWAYASQIIFNERTN